MPKTSQFIKKILADVDNFSKTLNTSITSAAFKRVFNESDVVILIVHTSTRGQLNDSRFIIKTCVSLNVLVLRRSKKKCMFLQAPSMKRCNKTSIWWSTLLDDNPSTRTLERLLERWLCRRVRMRLIWNHLLFHYYYY
jgi:hypothetical protein